MNPAPGRVSPVAQCKGQYLTFAQAANNPPNDNTNAEAVVHYVEEDATAVSQVNLGRVFKNESTTDLTFYAKLKELDAGYEPQALKTDKTTTKYMAHAEDYLIKALLEKWPVIALERDENYRVLLSIRMNRAPCEICARNLIRVRKALGIEVRIKATFITVPLGLAELADAGIHFRLWSEEQRNQKPGFAKKGQTMDALRGKMETALESSKSERTIKDYRQSVYASQDREQNDQRLASYFFPDHGKPWKAQSASAQEFLLGFNSFWTGRLDKMKTQRAVQEWETNLKKIRSAAKEGEYPTEMSYESTTSLEQAKTVEDDMDQQVSINGKLYFVYIIDGIVAEAQRRDPVNFLGALTHWGLPARFLADRYGFRMG